MKIKINLISNFETPIKEELTEKKNYSFGFPIITNKQDKDLY